MTKTSKKDCVCMSVVLLALVFSGASCAEIYKWTDANGCVHFSDQPPDNVKPQKVAPVLNTYKYESKSIEVYKASDVGEEFAYYDIYPIGGRSLMRALNDATPIVQDGIKYHGSTKWDVTWRLKWRVNAGVCRIVAVNTDVKVRYTMPRLADQGSNDEGVKISFNKFYDALMVHEKGHAASGLYAARDIEEQLLFTAPSKDCKSVEQAANVTAKNIISKYRIRDKEYDGTTQHGKTQGAYAGRI